MQAIIFHDYWVNEVKQIMDTSPTGHFAYGTIRLLYILPTGHFAYWLFRLRDTAFRTLRLWSILPTGQFAYYLDISPTRPNV